MWLGDVTVAMRVLETRVRKGVRVRISPEPPHICFHGETVDPTGLNPVLLNGECRFDSYWKHQLWKVKPIGDGNALEKRRV